MTTTRAVSLLAVLTLAGCPEGEAGSDSEAAETAGEQAQPSFENQLQPALSGLSGMIYSCDYGGEQNALLYMQDSGAMRVEIEDAVLAGSYLTDGAVSLSIPDIPFAETAVDHAVELDLLVWFQTPSITCHAVATEQLDVVETTVLKCPTIRYIPSVSFQDNELHLSDGGMARWRQWDELVAANDTLYSDRYGIYVRIGDRVFMVFGGAKDAEDQFLSATVTDQGLVVDQLEPERGACTD